MRLTWAETMSDALHWSRRKGERYVVLGYWHEGGWCYHRAPVTAAKAIRHRVIPPRGRP